MTKNQKPHVPFDKMPFQEKRESDLQLKSDDLDATEKLDLSENEKRQHKRPLAEERDAGHEP
jgi:hypothetical protein